MYNSAMTEDIVLFRDAGTRNQEFHIEMAGISHCDGSYVIKRKNSPYYAVEYILKGTGYLHINGRDFQPSEGDVYIVDLGSDHEYGSLAHDPWVKIWVAFAGSVADILFEQLSLSGIFHVRDCNMEDELRNIYRAAKSHVHAEHFHKESAVLIHELLYQIYSFVYPVDDDAIDPVDLAITYMRMHIHLPISMVELTRYAGKSSSQLTRLFKRRFEKTPHDYFLDIKMARAKTLLSDSTLLIRQIAANLGFCDAFHFSKMFKKTTELSPTEYRQTHTLH
jgi:AraC family transcriptional regulator, arabinose operon regulatory protein